MNRLKSNIDILKSKKKNLVKSMSESNYDINKHKIVNNDLINELNQQTDKVKDLNEGNYDNNQHIEQENDSKEFINIVPTDCTNISTHSRVKGIETSDRVHQLLKRTAS